MKKYILVLLLFSGFLTFGQASNKAIVNAYVKRANTAMEQLDAEQALKNFEKALERLDTITDRRIAKLGSLIYFELHHKQDTAKDQLEYLKISKEYLNQYFRIYNKENTEEYSDAIDDQLMYDDAIEELELKIKEEEEEELRRKLELKRIDSLKTVWQNKSESLSIAVDSIYAFNKNKIALFKKGGFYGLMNDVGETILNADEYVDVVNFDNYFIFKNKETAPNKLYCYNSKAKNGFLIPFISDFNTLSTHYGKVMLPRGNGRLVTYPNNSTEPLVFDLNVRKAVKVANTKELFKSLDKSDAIDKSNSDGEVKVNKEWYKFGGHLGGGIHPLYAEEGYNLKAFLCAIDGKVLNATTDYQYIGAFYNGKFEALKGTERVWINQNGTIVGNAKNKAGTYNGKSKVVKLENGKYQIMMDGMIILGDEQLEKMPDFLKKNNVE